MNGADRLMRALLRRAERIAAGRVARRQTELAQAYAEALPGVAVSTDPRGVLLRGRRLLARMMADPRLRWPGRWLS